MYKVVHTLSADNCLVIFGLFIHLDICELLVAWGVRYAPIFFYTFHY